MEHGFTFTVKDQLEAAKKQQKELENATVKIQAAFKGKKVRA